MCSMLCYTTVANWGHVGVYRTKVHDCMPDGSDKVNHSRKKQAYEFFID